MDFLSEEFDRAAIAAIDKAVRETLAAGVPIFYMDENGLDVKELPDGRKFRIRYIAHAPGEQNYEILHELRAAA